MATPSEHEGGVSLQGEAPSQDPSPRFLVPRSRAPPDDRIKIAHRDGDVALLFDVPKEFELIVNGKIISDASPIFRKILASHPYGQSARSVDHPHVLKVNNWKAGPGLILTFGVLHGVSRLSNGSSMADKKDDGGSLELLKVAETAKQFSMVEFMKPVISPNLLTPFVERSYEGDEDPFRTDAELAAIAYLLDQDDDFSLFTRHLIMDHCVPLSTCAPALFAAIPAKAILQLEEQRIAATRLIDKALLGAATHHCDACGKNTCDTLLVQAIGKKLDPPVVMWPPSYGKHHTIRQVLAALASLDDDFRPFCGDTVDKVCCAGSNDLRTAEKVREVCQSVAWYVSMNLPGLCFTCVKEDRTQIRGCEHRDTKLHQKDSLGLAKNLIE